MTTPEPLHVDVLPAVPRIKLNNVVMVASLVMMAVCVYLLWKGDRRLTESDARFHDTLHTIKERTSTVASPSQPSNGQRFSADACSVDCAEGHTYQRGCVQYVEPSNDQQTEAL